MGKSSGADERMFDAINEANPDVRSSWGWLVG